MNKPILYSVYLFAFCLISCKNSTSTEVNLSAKPNIILIIADDLGARLGCYGDTQAKTPNIDRLADAGVRFENTYCQLPTCAPSRASMLTGLYPWQSGIYDNHPPVREALPDIITLPQFLRQHGYLTARAGKIYHTGIPGGIGSAGSDDPWSWDLTVNSTGWDAKKENLAKVHKTADRGLGIVPSWLAPQIPDSAMADGQTTLQAIRLMEAFHPRKTGQPLMLSVGYYRPHPPMVAPERYFDMHELNDIELPEVPENDREDIPAVAFELKGEAFNFIADSVGRKYTQAYYAALSFVDAQVGQLIEALKANQLWDNSIIIFTGDQGFHLGEHGHWHKTTLFEEGTQVPLIIAGHGINQGQTSETLTELVDVYPTLMQMLNLEAPHPMAGKSLVNQLYKNEENQEAVALTRVRQAEGISMRTSNYRLTSWTIAGEKVYELYNHQQDPREINNLANVPEYQDVLEELKIKLNQHYQPEILYKK